MRLTGLTLAAFGLGLTAQPTAALQVSTAEAALSDSTLAPPASEVRVVVSLHERRLWVMVGLDTLRTASVAVASGGVLHYGQRSWRFATPLGKHLVRTKTAEPVWLPPDWHYVEAAREHRLRVKWLPPAGLRLSDGRHLSVRDSIVGLVTDGDAFFAPLPVDEHIVFDATLFIPPLGTRNRRLVGELGKYALDLGNGYLLHGTRDQGTIGSATTHGCIRLADDDLAWLYEHVPVGAAVFVR